MAESGQLAGEDSFDDFYRTSYQRLVGQLFAVVGDLQQAEDIVQDAFIQALIRWASIEQYEQPEAWVRRVALNLAVSRFRRLRRELAALLRLRNERPAPVLTPQTDSLLEILRRVPINQRVVLMLHDVHDLTVEDIAAQLHLPVSTVRGRLSRARDKLRRELKNDQEVMAVRS